MSFFRNIVTKTTESIGKTASKTVTDDIKDTANDILPSVFGLLAFGLFLVALKQSGSTDTPKEFSSITINNYYYSKD